jgi:membrane fusion protein, copper/silver efflux system
MVDGDRGAYWLSEFEQIKNPYFGDMMLRCGEVREILREGVRKQDQFSFLASRSNNR